MPESNSRSAIVAKNALFSVLSWILPLGLNLIVTPIILSGLGTASFGIYALALGFIGYSFTFGVGKAAGKYVAQFKAAGDTKAISEAVTAVLIASAVLGVVAAIVFWLFSRALVVELLALPHDQIEAATRSLQFAGMVILFTMISLVYQNILQGIQRFDRLFLISNISAVSMNAGAAVIALNGGTVEALLLWNLITVAGIAIVFFLTAKALLPQLRFDTSVRHEIRKKIFFYSGSIILYQVAGNLLFIFERSLIVREFGTSVLTFYAIPLSLAVHFLGFAAGISLAVFPAANSLLGDKDKSLILYKVSTKLLVGASSFFLLGAILFGREFLALWLGTDFAEHSYNILVFHSATFAIMGATIIAWQFTESNEKFGLNAAFTATSSLVAAILMIFLFRIYGPEGIAFSRFAGSSILIFLIIVFEKRIFGTVLLPLWLMLPIKVLVAALAAGTASYFLSNLLPEGWPTLLAEAAISFIIFCIALFSMRFFAQDEIEIFKSVLGRLSLRGQKV